MKAHSSKGQGGPPVPQAPQPPPVPIEVVKAALKRKGVRYGPAKEPRLRQLYEGMRFRSRANQAKVLLFFFLLAFTPLVRATARA